MAGTDLKVALVICIGDCYRKTGPGRPAMLADQVGSQASQEVEQDGGLFIPVGVQLDPALLHEHPAKVVRPVKGVACEVASLFALHSLSRSEEHTSELQS